MITLMFFSRLEHAMIRKDWYRTIVIESKDGVEQLKAIRGVIAEHRSEITDFEADRAGDGAYMTLKIGLKFYQPRMADRMIEEIGCLDGVKHAKWELE